MSLLMLVPLNLASLGTAISADNRRGEIRANEALERRRIVNVGGGLLLDGLKDMAFTASNDGMQLLIDFTSFSVQTTL